MFSALDKSSKQPTSPQPCGQLGPVTTSAAAARRYTKTATGNTDSRMTLLVYMRRPGRGTSVTRFMPLIHAWLDAIGILNGGVAANISDARGAGRQTFPPPRGSGGRSL